MSAAKITRTRIETRRYERPVLVVLDMAKGQTRATAQKIVVVERLGDVGPYDRGVRVTLHVKRTKRDGQPTFSGKSAYDLALVDVDPVARPWHEIRDFTPETVARLRLLREQALVEFGSIDWEGAGNDGEA